MKKSYSIEWQTNDGCTGWSTLIAETIAEVVNKFMSMHPDYRMLAVSEMAGCI